MNMYVAGFTGKKIRFHDLWTANHGKQHKYAPMQTGPVTVKGETLAKETVVQIFSPDH